MGAVDSLPAPGAAGAGRAPLRRAGSHRGLGGYGQNGGRPPPRGAPGSRQPRGAHPSDDFSNPLASALRVKLARLIGTEPRLRERIDVDALETVARRLHDGMLGRAQVVSRDGLRELVREAARETGDQKFSLGFLLPEWPEVVDAWPNRPGAA